MRGGDVVYVSCEGSTISLSDGTTLVISLCGNTT